MCCHGYIEIERRGQRSSLFLSADVNFQRSFTWMSFSVSVRRPLPTTPSMLCSYTVGTTMAVTTLPTSTLEELGRFVNGVSSDLCSIGPPSVHFGSTHLM